MQRQGGGKITDALRRQAVHQHHNAYIAQNGKDQTAQKPLHRFFGAYFRAELMLSAQHPGKIPADIAPPGAAQQKCKVQNPLFISQLIPVQQKQPENGRQGNPHQQGIGALPYGKFPMMFQNICEYQHDQYINGRQAVFPALRHQQKQHRIQGAVQRDPQVLLGQTCGMVRLINRNNGQRRNKQIKDNGIVKRNGNSQHDKSH